MACPAIFARPTPTTTTRTSSSAASTSSWPIRRSTSPRWTGAKLVNDAGKVDARFPLGLPTVNNANYLWINLFYAALNATGRAGFVMANSASDAGGSEREMRRKLIETGAVDCIVAVGPNMFFTVTLPVTLWFLDKGKAKGPRGDRCCSSMPGTSSAR